MCVYICSICSVCMYVCMYVTLNRVLYVCMYVCMYVCRDETDLSPQVNMALRQQIVQYVTMGVRNSVLKIDTEVRKHIHTYSTYSTNIHTYIHTYIHVVQ